MHIQSRLPICLGLLFITIFLASCNVLSPQSTNHLRFGNPSNATTNIQNDENYLIQKPQFALSYNRKLGRANWVSWELTQNWMGEADRQDDFRPDPQLPPTWDAITPRAYRRSGYDRGHLVPSADRTKTIADNSATFVMTNIIPQTPDNNQGPWRDLEEDCRDWVESGNFLQIIAGGYGKKTRIGNKTVTPPSRVWKAILIAAPGSSPESIDTETIAIAVDMPNKQGIRDDDWTQYQVSVDDLEQKIGYDLFSDVNDDVETVIEAKVNRSYPKDR